MEHRQSPLDNENKRRQNSAEKSSDASSSERLQKSRNSHLIGRGINPRDGLSQQVGTDEAASSRVDKQNTTHHDTQNSLEHDIDRDPRQDEKKLAERETREKQAITTPSDGDSNHSNTQGRNEKRQLSALEEALEEKWSQSISLDEYGHRLSKIFELTSISTHDKPILVGGMKNLWGMLGPRETGGSSHSNQRSEAGDQRSEAGDQRSEVDKWIGQTLGSYKLVEYLRKKEDRNHEIRLVYRGEHIHSNESVEVEVPKEAGKWIGQKSGNYKLIEYLREYRRREDSCMMLVYRGEHVDSNESVEVEVPKEAGKWIGQKSGNYKLIEYLREYRRREDSCMMLVYRGEHVDSNESVEVEVPKEAGKWIGQKLGGYKLVEYLREDSISLAYRGKYSNESVEVKVLKQQYKNDSETTVKQFHEEVEVLKIFNHPAISYMV